MNKFGKRILTAALATAMVVTGGLVSIPPISESKVLAADDIQTYNIDIAWGDMQFDYSTNNTTWSVAENKTNTIGLTNNSGCDIVASFDFTAAAAYSDLGAGIFTSAGTTVRAKTVADNGTETVSFMPTGSIPATVTEYTRIGDITVTFAAKEKDEDADGAYTGDKVTIQQSGIDVNFYPGWVRKAATFSFDDGYYNEWYYANIYNGSNGARPKITMSTSTEAKILKIMNDNGVKGTFNLVTNWVAGSHGTDEAAKTELRTYYAGQEVGSHSKSHPFMTNITETEIIQEITESTSVLTDLMGYKPTAFAWPYNGILQSSYADSWAALEEEGYLFSRTTASALSDTSADGDIEKHGFNATVTDSSYKLLRQFQATGNTPALAKPDGNVAQKFLNYEDDGKLKLWYTWGHSFDYVVDEFGVGFSSQTNYGNGYPVTNETKIAQFEGFCKLLGADDSIWKATNSEVIGYLAAMAKVSVSGRTVTNASDRTIYITVDGVRKTQGPNTTITY